MSTPARRRMTAGRPNHRRSGRSYFLLALLLVAFAASGWKAWRVLPAASFAAQRPAIVAPPETGASDQKAVPGDQPALDARFVSSSPGQAVHAASLVELRDGRLQAVWFSGSREGAGDVTIQTAFLDPNTLRWSAERTLFDRQAVQRGLWRYVKKLGNPVIARSPDGSLYLWMVNVSVGGWAGSAITWSRSIDDGQVWSPPRRLVTSPFLNISTLVKGPPVALVDGQMVLPVYHEFVTKFAEVLRLDSDGQVLDKVRVPGSQTSLQPVLLVAGPTAASLYMRSGTAGTIMRSSTTDAGKTWSATQATSLPNPDSALAGVVTGTGRQWLAFNPTAAGRGVLALLSSGPEGFLEGASPWRVDSYAEAPGVPKVIYRSDYERSLSRELRAAGASDAQTQAYTASAMRQLCGPDSCSPEFSYPYLLQTRDGFIHLVYTWHRTRIKHVRLDPRLMSQSPPPVSAHVLPAH